jgi:hypothetical protein
VPVKASETDSGCATVHDGGSHKESNEQNVDDPRPTAACSAQRSMAADPGELPAQEPRVYCAPSRAMEAGLSSDGGTF